MCAHIVFPKNSRRKAVEIRKVHAVEISQSIDDIYQTAKLTLPRNVSQFQEGQLKELIRRNDAVVISLGYNGELEEEFAGYVRSVGADTPVVIELCDNLWKLMQEPFHKAYKSLHLPAFLKDLVGDEFEYEAMDATIGPVVFKRTTKGQAMKALKDEFGLVTYLRGNKVYCGVLFDKEAPSVTYDMERNVRNNDLKYRLAEDVSLKVTAVSLQKDGSKIEVEVGDPGGESRSLNYYGISNKAELKKLAEADMLKFKYDGYEGTLSGWGRPLCQFGDRVLIKSTLYPERDGQYLAESVTITFGPDGFKRAIKPAQQWTI